METWFGCAHQQPLSDTHTHPSPPDWPACPEDPLGTQSGLELLGDLCLLSKPGEAGEVGQVEQEGGKPFNLTLRWTVSPLCDVLWPLQSMGVVSSQGGHRAHQLYNLGLYITQEK